MALPASYERVGQRVTMPEQVLTTKNVGKKRVKCSYVVYFWKKERG